MESSSNEIPAIFLIAGIIVLVLNLCILIDFFRMSKDISIIKKHLTKSAFDWEVEYRKQKAFGNKDKALGALQNLVWAKFEQIVDGKDPNRLNKTCRNNLERLRLKYEADFFNFNLEYPNLLDVYRGFKSRG